MYSSNARATAANYAWLDSLMTQEEFDNQKLLASRDCYECAIPAANGKECPHGPIAMSMVARATQDETPLGVVAHRIQEVKAIRAKPKGMKCSRCGNGNDYAEPNSPDGSFVCYTCR
jgi:hypothetical protein